MDHRNTNSELKNTYIIDILKTSNIPGGAIRDIAMGILQLSEEIGLRYKAKAIVVDTNIILKDLGYAYCHKKATILYSEALFGFAKVFATPSVMEEVAEKIPKYAASKKVDSEDLFSLWEDYKKVIIVLTPETHQSEAIQRLKKRDPDDVATAELIESILPDLALSDDKDLCDYAQSGDWLRYIFSMSKSISRDAVNIILTFGTSAIIICLSPIFEGLFHILKTLFSKVPKQLLVIACSSLAILIIDTRSRSWMTAKIKKLFNSDVDSHEGIRRLFIEQINVLATVYRAGYEADAILKGLSNQEVIPLNLRGHVIRVLMRSAVPLSVNEIFERVQEAGYQPKGESSPLYLKRILKGDAIFIQDKNGKWELAKEAI